MIELVPKRRRRRAFATLGVVAALTGGTTLASAPPAGAAYIPSLGYDSNDLGSMTSITQIVGAQTAWAAGFTGKGVDVAVIDTGVARVPGIPANQVIDGPDLSFDSQTMPADLAGVDANGHGTHMASLIIGRDPNVSNSNGKCGTCTGQSGYSDSTKFVGVAPDARVVNMKVGAHDGAVDVSQVIAAINWVIQHKNDNGMNIRVLNLSYGTHTTQSYLDDPLSYAVEQAWKHGIFVVTAAGNDGVDTTSLANPALNPWVLAVGATSSNGTLDRANDTVPDFATHGNNQRKVDVVAPGASVLGLNVPGSYVDQEYGDAGRVGTRFLRGSGTSQASAIVSGVAAIAYQKFPTATPDQMKKLLMNTAYRLPKVNSLYRGNGIVDASMAIAASLTTWVNTGDLPATGKGTLDGARGADRLVVDGQPLSGEKDIFGRSWSSTTIASQTKGRTAWTGGQFNGGRWSGDSWNNGRWTATTWVSANWAGTGWTDPTMTTMVWDGNRWTGNRWTGARWSGNHWG